MCLCACMFVCMCVYVCVCMYVCMNTHSNKATSPNSATPYGQAFKHMNLWGHSYSNHCNNPLPVHTESALSSVRREKERERERERERENMQVEGGSERNGEEVKGRGWSRFD